VRIKNIATGEINFFKDVFPDDTPTIIGLEQLGYEVYQYPIVEPVIDEDPIQQATRDLEAYYDSVAKIKKYDNRLTCALRAGYEGPFQAEGIAFATWMDTCNDMVYQLVADISNGIRASMTVGQFISELPVAPW
jgi:hypothetical protein